MARARETPDESEACQLRLFDSPSVVMQGHQPKGDSTTAIRFAAWYELNKRDVWPRCFVEPALHEAEHDRRVSVQRLIEQVRARDYVNWEGQPCKIDNSYAPLIARKLVHDFPQLKGHIEMRRSGFDYMLTD